MLLFITHQKCVLLRSVAKCSQFGRRAGAGWAIHGASTTENLSGWPDFSVPALNVLIVAPELCMTYIETVFHTVKRKERLSALAV